MNSTYPPMKFEEPNERIRGLEVVEQGTPSEIFSSSKEKRTIELLKKL